MLFIYTPIHTMIAGNQNKYTSMQNTATILHTTTKFIQPSMSSNKYFHINIIYYAVWI